MTERKSSTKIPNTNLRHLLQFYFLPLRLIQHGEISVGAEGTPQPRLFAKTKWWEPVVWGADGSMI